MVDVDEEILAKTGPALFKELLRIYPVAEVEDYFKAGQWNNGLMKCDLQLVHVHRREAGAPDPIPLEEVKMPEMPQAGVGIQLPAGAAAVAAAGVRPPGQPVPAIRPGAPKAGTVVPAPGATAAGAVTELRLIALFIAKWKLDPNQTKMLLAKLMPARRRFVMQHFKCAVQGVEAMRALVQFIAKCEQTNAWAGAVAPAAAAAGIRPAGTPVAAAMKRPLGPGATAMDPAAKRPHMVGAVGPKTIAAKPGMAKPAMAKPVAPLRPAGPGAIRPGGPGMIRPTGAIRPATITPKAGGQPGGLIKGLLQRF